MPFPVELNFNPLLFPWRQNVYVRTFGLTDYIKCIEEIKIIFTILNLLFKKLVFNRHEKST